MERVFVLNKNKHPLMPCRPARVRRLLKAGRAAVYRTQPFTIILKDREGGDTQPIELKLDPGANTTGISLVADFARGKEVIWAAELAHRGPAIRKALEKRRMIRQGRRTRKRRHRKPRWANRRRPERWLPPSIQSRVDNITRWSGRLQELAPITAIAVETVRFDLQKVVNPEVSGVEYQRGELFGYELREYLLEKFQRKCVYCGAENILLEVKHIIPRSRGGSNRVSNLTLSCRECNIARGNRTAVEFGHPKVQIQARAPLKDAAAVNASRYAIGNALKELGLPISFWSGGRTKFNRTRQHYPKAHWIDAACVGITGEKVQLDPSMKLVEISALGRGNRQKCRMDAQGFPCSKPQSVKRIHGLQTGDLVRLNMPQGKYAGVHTGRIAGVRATGIVDVKTTTHKISASGRHCILAQKFDGYGYRWQRGRLLDAGEWPR